MLNSRWFLISASINFAVSVAHVANTDVEIVVGIGIRVVDSVLHLVNNVLLEKVHENTIYFSFVE